MTTHPPGPDPAGRTTPDAIAAAAVALLGRRIVAAEPLIGSVENVNAMVTTATGERFVVKTGPAASMERERLVTTLVAEAGIPGTRIAAAGVGILAIPVIAGRPVEPATDPPSILVEAALAVARVHEITVTGFGFAQVDAGQVRGEHSTWQQVADAAVARLPELVAHGVLESAFADDIAACVTTHPFPACDLPRLLHNDLKPGHLFTDGRHLTAIIDWGDPVAGDPLYDLAPLARDRETFAPFFDAYGAPLDAPTVQQLAAYRVARDLEVIHFEWASGGDWFAAYRDRMRADLDLLE